jgi:hypothetical protein
MLRGRWAALGWAAVVVALFAYARVGPPNTGEQRPRAARSPASPPTSAWQEQVTRARLASVKYATDPDQARADGYRVVTATEADPDVYRPEPSDAASPVLLYIGTDAPRLVALEWLSTSPAPPLPGVTSLTVAAACHYADGQIIAGDESSCQPRHPITYAPLSFWQPALTTLVVWLWYP